MRIAEIYSSIQGEGLLTGTESVFVRTSGCNLRCGYCDTPYTSWQPEGGDWSVPEIVATVESQPARHVVITGGEPMLYSELIPLCTQLADRGLHLTIETAGTLYLPLAVALMSISPKLSNSAPSRARFPDWYERHERTRHAPEVVRQLIALGEYQLKFVVGCLADCDEVEAYLRQLPEVRRDRVLLMPQGTEAAELADIGNWLQSLCGERGVVFCPRRHIEWYGHRRGT